MGKIIKKLTEFTWRCPECGHRNASGTIRCAKCGKCWREISTALDGVELCSECRPGSRP